MFTLLSKCRAPYSLTVRLMSSSPEMLKIEHHGKVALITLNRPKALNALCAQLMSELTTALSEIDNNPGLCAVVLTGSRKAFAAGADIREMESLTSQTAYKSNFIYDWSRVADTRKPLIAAVNGYALGGGCELAMMCDIIIAGDEAQFAQPEIKLGTIPGAGGTQRLVKAIGKSRAMELILTGDFMGAEEACSRGLVSRVVPADKLVDEALAVAKKISEFSLPIVMMAKECVNYSYDSGLSSGLLFERRVFHATFGFEDRSEGMKAFSEKRKAEFKDN